jgi:hypothetical protein
MLLTAYDILISITFGMHCFITDFSLKEVSSCCPYLSLVTLLPAVNWRPYNESPVSRVWTEVVVLLLDFGVTYAAADRTSGK